MNLQQTVFLEKEHKHRLVAILCIIFFTACAPSPVLLSAPTQLVPTLQPTLTATLPSPTATSPTPTPTTTAIVRPTRVQTISAEALQYLTTALDIMAQNALHRKELDWNALSSEALWNAYDSQTPAETYAAIRMALSQLGDRGHSTFWTPAEVKAVSQPTVGNILSPKGDFLQGRWGYIFMPGFGGTDSDHRYATLLQQIVREVDTQNPCGWIVDLRQNTGGNMWPMLVGIGPIVGEGPVGAFIAPNGQSTEWSYRNGQAFNGNHLQAQVNEQAYKLIKPLPTVAVLTSSTTASSGEAMVIAFRGRPNTRSFGDTTRGLPTANAMFTLSDGAGLNLTIANMVDRTGHIYENEIMPDELMRRPTWTGEAVLQAAIDWLSSQPSCANSR